MSVLLGNASISENGTIRGTAGDQTGKEVCTRSWYSGGWIVCLRPLTATVAEKSAQACEAACVNPNIGYDQYERNTLRTQAKAAGWDISKITTPCECDCSSLMAVCAEAAGVNMNGAYSYGNAPTTYTMQAAFVATGAYSALTTTAYTTTDVNLKRGDILVSKGHTVMVLGNGTAATAASKKSSAVSINLPVLGTAYTADAGYVKHWQMLMNAFGHKGADGKALTVDGEFGTNSAAATKAFQKAHGLTQDGIVGRASWTAALKES